MIYFVINENSYDNFDGSRYFYTDVHKDVLAYVWSIGKSDVVSCSDYIFRIINGKTFYLKNRTDSKYQYTEEDLVVLRLAATKL